MKSYTVRIELRNGSDADHDRLNENMRAEGFLRTVESSDGKKFRLPHGEYDFYGKAGRSEVLERARQAAGKGGCDYAILVTESNGRTWCGLRRGEASVAQKQEA